MSGTDPRDRKARREQTVKRVRNPEGGTYRVWNPGSVDLRADVAVGAKNPMKVAGAAQDSGGVFPAALEGHPSLRELSAPRPRAAPRNGGSLEDREVVETTWREP
jgi:hypothetical protein